jgi:hypothetical protein
MFMGVENDVPSWGSAFPGGAGTMPNLLAIPLVIRRRGNGCEAQGVRAESRY